MKLTIIALLLGVVSVAFAAPTAKEAQFFSGVYLLQTSPGLSNAEKARKFRELEMLTGIDAKKAAMLLSSYGQRPVEWRKLCDSMIPMLSGIEEKKSVPAMPKNYSPGPGARR